MLVIHTGKAMSQQLSALLQQTIDRELPHLRAVEESTAEIPPAGPSSWSPKEELGHLIDSAANNHMRFVRAALDGFYRGPGYAQNDWVRIHGYRQMPWETLVSTWYLYNSLLAGLVANIPENKLDADCFIASAELPDTLGFVIHDYVLHMQHHIDHLLKRQSITEYPSAARLKAAANPV
jgi:DinB superfamily